MPPADPAAGDALAERLLLRLELNVLFQDEDKSAEAVGLGKLILGRLRIAGAEDQQQDVGLGDEVEERALRAFRARADGLGQQRPHVENLDRPARGGADPFIVALDRTDKHRLHGDHRTVGARHRQCLSRAHGARWRAARSFG